MKNLEYSIKELTQLKISLNNYINIYNKLNELIIQKENKNYFISFQIKDKREKIIILRNYRDNINTRINYLNRQISSINSIVNNSNNLYDYNYGNYYSSYRSAYNNYLDDNKFNQKINSIDNLDNEAKKKIAYINNNCNGSNQLENF